MEENVKVEKNESTQNALESKPEEALMIVKDSGPLSLFMDTARFRQAWRAAQLFASSTVIPEHYQGNPSNCLIALHSSDRLKVDPVMFMQKSYVLKGKPGIEAQLKIALVNNRGPFKGRIQWEYKKDATGKTIACTAYAILKENDERCSYTITWDTVLANKWNYKWDKDYRGIRGEFIEDPNSKWNTIRDKMFAYRAASWLIDLYCPEVVMGLPTKEELEEEELKIIDITPTLTTTESATQDKADELKTRLLAAKEAQKEQTPGFNQDVKNEILMLSQELGIKIDLRTIRNAGQARKKLEELIELKKNKDLSGPVSPPSGSLASGSDDAAPPIPEAEKTAEEPEASLLFEEDKSVEPPQPWKPTARFIQKIKDEGLQPRLVIEAFVEAQGQEGRSTMDEIRPEEEKLINMNRTAFQGFLNQLLRL